jgi:predicted transcriptional regulator
MKMPLRLEEYRRKRHLSQVDLSYISGVSRSYISELEAGKYDPTKAICKLCFSLQVEPNELITGWEWFE